MPRRTVVIASRTGLHARPATLFVQAAAREPVPVRIATAGHRPVDARSILAVLSLGAGHGVEVTLEADEDGAAETLDRLAAMLARDLDAKEAEEAEEAAEAEEVA
jgi:phosphocarrier protein